MNELQKECAVKELKREIKENLRIKLHRFFFSLKALITIGVFICSEYLMLAHKLPVSYNHWSLQLVIVITLAVVISQFTCIMQALKYKCYDNLASLCNRFAIASIILFSISYMIIINFIAHVEFSRLFDESSGLALVLVILRLLQLKTNKERLKDLGINITEEKYTGFSKEIYKESKNG